MDKIFFAELDSKMYPSTLLHAYGVNGKISGSVGAVGEMGEDVVAVVHGPRGCAFHYRCSARRRRQPFYNLFTSDLTQQEIIFGGEEKLRRTVLEIWEHLHPACIFIIPTPVSDVLNADIQSVAAVLRRQGIPVVGIRSELFSHRDKNYTRNRLREIARQKITGDNRLEMELKGCGFTEALCAVVEQVMEPQTVIPRSVNIETVGWGSEGRVVLREMEQFLSRCGVLVNTWIPSSPIKDLAAAPAAQLNLVKRVRWARQMKARFGTDYLHLGGSGRYVGLDGIGTLYRDIGEKLGIGEEMDALVEKTVQETMAETTQTRATLGQFHCVLVCRGLQDAPATIKLYTQSFGLSLSSICLILTEETRRNMHITPEVEQQLLGRIREAAALYGPCAEILLNAPREKLAQVFSQSDAVLGTNDFTLEGLGAPLIPAWCEMTSLTFPSYVRNIRRLERRLCSTEKRDELLLNRMPICSERFPRLDNASSMAAREMWDRMWLHRKETKP